MKASSHKNLFGLPKNATAAQIEAAYRREVAAIDVTLSELRQVLLQNSFRTLRDALLAEREKQAPQIMQAFYAGLSPLPEMPPQPQQASKVKEPVPSAYTELPKIPTLIEVFKNVNVWVDGSEKTFKEPTYEAVARFLQNQGKQDLYLDVAIERDWKPGAKYFLNIQTTEGPDDLQLIQQALVIAPMIAKIVQNPTNHTLQIPLEHVDAFTENLIKALQPTPNPADSPATGLVF